ncbi:MAG: hypothetical protein GX557_06790 [Chloroflexi bacterium]|nr:hypothetical protein [Chloroflexota bacterium]
MWLAGIRDGAIVLLAVESVVIGVLLLLTLVQIRKLVRVLRDQIKPLLQDAKDTMQTVQGTSRFVSDNLVSPIVKAQSYTAGVRSAVHQLLMMNRKRSD